MLPLQRGSKFPLKFGNAFEVWIFSCFYAFLIAILSYAAAAAATWIQIPVKIKFRERVWSLHIQSFLCIFDRYPQLCCRCNVDPNSRQNSGTRLQSADSLVFSGARTSSRNRLEPGPHRTWNLGHTEPGTWATRRTWNLDHMENLEHGPHGTWNLGDTGPGTRTTRNLGHTESGTWVTRNLENPKNTIKTLAFADSSTALQIYDFMSIC